MPKFVQYPASDALNKLLRIENALWKYLVARPLAAERFLQYQNKKSHFNSILQEVFDLYILHGGRHFCPLPPNLTSKPKVMGAPNLACRLVFT